MSNATQIPSYKNGLEELRTNLANMLPAEVLQIFDNDAESLQKEHANPLKINTGDKAPMFSLMNATGDMIAITDLLKESKVILTFYRGAWCPYCNLQLNQYQQAVDTFKELNAQLVAVSPQTPDASLTLQEKNSLNFEVLSDNGNVVAKQYTTVFKNSDTGVETMQNLGIDFDSHYSDDSREIPVPAVFVIEQDGTIAFAKSTGGDNRNRVEVSDIISALK